MKRSVTYCTVVGGIALTEIGGVGRAVGRVCSEYTLADEGFRVPSLGRGGDALACWLKTRTFELRGTLEAQRTCRHRGRHGSSVEGCVRLSLR